MFRLRLFRFLIIWICLMATSLHTIGARTIAIANGIEERTKVSHVDGKAYSIVTDQLGTPTEAYNVEGEEVWRRRLDMNGKILGEVYDQYAPYSEQIRIPFLFQGQYYDYETELAYNRFRYYSPELGRYISEDPIRFESGTLALHSYVEDSNGWIDAFGLKTYKRTKHVQNRHVDCKKHQPKTPAQHISKYIKPQQIKKLESRTIKNSYKKTIQPDGRIVYEKDFGRRIGTKGETKLRVVVDLQKTRS